MENNSASRLHFIRHGQSAYNQWDIDSMTSQTIPPGIMTDEQAPLTKEGEAEAAVLGEAWAILLQDTPHALIHIFCSSWDRAVATRNIALERINARRPTGQEVLPTTEPDPRLTDQHLGLSNPPYVAQYPQLADSFDRYWNQRRSGPQGRMLAKPYTKLNREQRLIARELGLTNPEERLGENLVDVTRRLQAWLDDGSINPLLQSPSQKNLVFAHAGILYASLHLFTGEPLLNIGHNVFYNENWTPNTATTTYKHAGNNRWKLQAWGTPPQDLQQVLSQQ